MTKKTQPPLDNSEVFERALDAATSDSTPKSDITAQLAAEGLDLLEIGYPEASELMLKARDEILRLRALASRASVPDGFVLVPREVTPAMLEAAGMMENYDIHARHCSPDADHAQWYRAVVAAAPEPVAVGLHE